MLGFDLRIPLLHCHSLKHFHVLGLAWPGHSQHLVRLDDLQRDNFFYRPVSYVMPVTLMRLPYSLLEALVWTGLTYWEIDLAPDAGR